MVLLPLRIKQVTPVGMNNQMKKFNGITMKYNNIIKSGLFFFMAFTMALMSLAQQTRTYNGLVLDEADEPVIGASVKVVGTTIGLITDLNGRFSLSVPEGKTVEISYIGYVTQRIKDFKQTTIVLKEDATQLDEVVVVGYGTQKKTHLTGAIATVPVEEITDLSSGNLANTLVGLVNGLSVKDGNARPGETARITIRQSEENTSINKVVDESKGPLYVIDGFISTAENFNNLDATMVESISVLKDASAAVYGARSANGVILVTTKQGKIGAPKISYSGQFGFTDEVSRTKMMDAYNYGKIWNAVAAANPSAVPNPRTDLFQKDELDTMKSLNYDLLDKYWDIALTQKHSINISGASERANYYGGISYFTQDGNLGKLDYERWNYRAGVDLKISKWIKANIQVSGDYGEKSKPISQISSNAESDYNILLTHPRYIPEYLGDYALATAGISNTYNDKNQQYHYSTIQNMGNYSKTMSQNTTINTGLEYDFGWSKILKGLKLKFTYSKNIGTTKQNAYASDYTLYQVLDRGGSGNHLYMDNGYTTGTGDEGLPMDSGNFSSIPISNGNYLRREFSRFDSYQMNFIVSYDRNFGSHYVNGLFTIERAESESEDLSGSVTNPYPFTNGQSNGTNDGKQSTGFSRTESGTLSYVGRINYVYADKYLLEVLVRTDASTKFAPENYWGTFPSVSAGWIISQENWFQENLKWIDYMKLRGSFGLLGRDNTTAWAWMQLYDFNQDKGVIFGNSPDKATGSHINIPDTGIANPHAHWDKSYKANFGIDFNTLRNRLTVGLDAYYEWNREMFTQNTVNIPSTVGSQPANENYGEIDNWGVELSLNWRDKIGKDFRYRIGINTGYSDNKVKKMYWQREIDKIKPNGRQDTGIWGLECIGMFRSYQEIEEYFAKYQITTYQNKQKSEIHPGMLIYKDVRGEMKSDGTYAGPDHKIDNNDIVQLSRRSDNPWGGTLNLGASWKDLSISAQVSANWGSYSLIPSQARRILNSDFSSSDAGYKVMEYNNIPSYFADKMFVYEDVYDANGNIVAEANRSAKYPNLRFNDINGYDSSFWRVSGTRITLRNITIAYSVPKHLITKLGIGSCRFNVTAQNVLNLYNPYPDNFYDPLSGSYGKYPTLRKITLGLNVSF